MSAVKNQIACDQLREIVALVLEIDVAEVLTDSHFYDDLSADSLEKVEIAVRIERDFGVSLNADEAAELSSVAAALALLRDKGVVG
ncbi:phosphopantetheine-binding protein [Streptomyces sp. NPDC005283]|uniref:acyl carrier protein n=1 Tax=unclassified Streptomyces TaxID=2593676 RepID=UPI00345469ED